ncbi:molybdopterin-dependent oxidoreductase [Paractinoplanes atraurantiacus]|uniref:DMSO/TMAO reductase YedYZ, molybdopterin-dependent catalytic subunit n=1 Tax=Paractinoplanes atraurantiacus TaxID=1036182 RepID=A0A285IGN7_9ACTN|nr:molybdopterin-dependent oxidoreductase [Actinoplanes atraurantiacus]SNY47134.1 DMSO/TMAO reductase YedYZ, molybdopterin-dependent catalytic subunit [Actinoplanes atraurantiacus]
MTFSSRQGGRRVDLVLGLLLIAGVLTGIAANTIGVRWPLNLIQLHAAGALAILILAPWKYVVIRRGLRNPRQRRPTKALSLTLLFFVLVTIGSGLLHSTGRAEHVGPLTLMQIHVGAAIGAVLTVVAHFFGHRVRPRRADADRRALLRLAALGAGAAVATAAWDTWAATSRRFTGSVPKARLEVTSWINDGIQRVDPAKWRLLIGSAALDLADVLALPHERFTATLDCTSGWYSTQEWEGVRLSAVLYRAGVAPDGGFRSVEVRSTTGFSRWFGADTLDGIWLVTAVGGQPLTYGHGFPARIVAPGRRGFWWVKWVTSIQPSSRPAWAQPFFPVS